MATYVVIGGGSGIGAAIARRLHGGATLVVVADLDQSAAQVIADRLDSKGTSAVARGTDLRDASSIAELVEEFGDTEGLAIAAGIFRAGPSLETTSDDFREILDVNLIGVFLAAQMFARPMVQRGRGSICVIASVAARMPRLRQAAYCASKAGIRQALRVLAMETVPHGVRINTVSPGPTDTPMMRRLATDHTALEDLASGSLEAFRPRIPAGRVGQANDVANAVAFLLDPASAHVSMQDLVVDGGELLGT